MIDYRTLTAEEISLALFEHFRRRQTVTKCWRKSAGKWRVEDVSFIDDWTEEEYELLVSCLQNTLRTGGMVTGAFSNGRLKGFVSVEGERFGSGGEYLDLSALHVSEERGAKGSAKPFSGGLKCGRKNAAGRNYTFRRIRRWKVRRSTARWVARKPKSIARRTWKKSRVTVSWNAFCKEKLFISDICPKERREAFSPRFTGAGMR